MIIYKSHSHILARNDMILIRIFIRGMIAISYTVTPTIRDFLSEIDQFRRGILLTPASPATESKLRWNATKEHIYGSLRLAGLSITTSELDHLFMHPTKHPSEEERQALSYKQALDVIRTEWTANPKPLAPSHIGAFSLIVQPTRTRETIRLLHESEQDMKRLLAYMGSQKDHPVLLAGVIYGQLWGTDIGMVSHGMLPRLMNSLILAKYGYDCRGLLALEPQWIEAQENHEKAFASIHTHGHLTAWLEHFTKAARYSFEALSIKIQHVSEEIAPDPSASLWLLNAREERVLQYLEHPATKITNRDAQRMFRVSQVTASRDLTHLATLGLLYAHGKGRSIYYTKV